MRAKAEVPLLNILRKRLVSYSLTVAAVSGAFALIPSILITVDKELYLVLGLDVSVYVVVLILAICRKIPYTIRATGFVLVLYLLATALILLLGPSISSDIFLYAVFAFAALLLDGPAAIAIVTLVFATIVALGFLLFTGVLNWNIGAVEWLAHMVNFLAVSAGLVFSTRFLMDRLTYSLRRQREYHRTLRAQREELSRSNRQLVIQAEVEHALLFELRHRVLNNLQVLESLLAVDQDHENTACFSRYRTRIHTLAIVHELLQTGENSTTVEGADLLRTIRSHMIHETGAENGHTWCSIEAGTFTINASQAGTIALLINELLHSWVRSHENRRIGDCMIVFQATDEVELRMTGSASSDIRDSFEKLVAGTAALLFDALVGQLDGRRSVTRDNSTITVSVTFRTPLEPEPRSDL